MSNNRLDDIFKDGLKDAKVSPPDHVWARIQASGVVQPTQNRGLIMMTTVRWAAAAVIALLMTVGGFWIFQKESATQGSIQIAEENLAPKKQIEGPEAESKGLFESTKEESEYVLEEDNTRLPVLNEDVSLSNKQVRKKNNTSQKRKDNIQKSIVPEQTPLHQEEEIQIAEVELIIPTQSLETIELKYVQSENAVSKSTLASLDAGANKDVKLKFSVDPNALIYAANKLGSERTVRERLFDKASEKMTDFAEAAGLPVRKWSKIKEVEILY